MPVKKHIYLRWLLLFIGWAGTLIILFLFLYPLYLKGDYKFFWQNTLMIVLWTTYLRIMVFFKQHPLLRYKAVRIGLILINIHLFILVLRWMQDILPLWEEMNIFSYFYYLKNELTQERQLQTMRYITHEIQFNGIAALLLIVILNIRTFASFFNPNVKSIKEFLNE